MTTPLVRADFDPISVAKRPESPRRLYFVGDLEGYRHELDKMGNNHHQQTEIIEHELAHYQTALAVGILGARYGVEYRGRFGKLGIKKNAIVDLGEFSGVPRIAVAAVFVAPIDPSPIDREGLRHFGYTDTKIVGEKIRAWNDTNPLQIPPPKSLVEA